MNLHKGNGKQTVFEFGHKPQYNYDKYSKVDLENFDRFRTGISNSKETVRVVNCGSLLTRCMQYNPILWTIEIGSCRTVIRHIMVDIFANLTTTIDKKFLEKKTDGLWYMYFIKS